MSTCPRLFEAEARRDGRLHGAELASYERHLSSCDACSAEVRSLETLAHVVRRQDRAASADDLHSRRERTRLLAAFDRALVTPRGRPSRTKPALTAAAIVAVLALGVWSVLPRAASEAAGDGPSASRAAVPRGPSIAAVHAEATARWSREKVGKLERIHLDHGGLTLRVAPSTDGTRIVVVLPDGELEDLGTTFTVRVDEGRTTFVSVDEGAVLLRLRGSPPILVGAGERWPTERGSAPPHAANPDVVAVPHGSGPPTSLDAAPSTPAPAASPRRSAPPGPEETPDAPASAAPRAPVDEAALELRAATAKLHGGDPRGAAAAFAAFVTHHPGHPRAEDAAYLRVIALQRTGDTAATRLAANDYLRRYPSGFRRAEVERLVQ